ncbi:MAG: ATP-binding protein [Rubrivivax sp.]
MRCDFGALARAVVEELQPAAAAKGLRLGVRGGGPAEEVLHELDPLRVSQIVRNLVANAVKYTPAGEVEVSWDRTPRGDGRDELRLLVRATGVGIPPEDRERLFRAYAQAGRGHPGGTGLGLALSRPLAEPMGGTIAFDSEPGRGWVFRFVVPAPRSAAVTPA